VSARIPDYCLMLPAAPWHPFMYFHPFASLAKWYKVR
jgi:hypothetical protein